MANPADNLNELVSLFQSIGPTADETNVRISWLGSVVQELESTLVMVGNNIVDQIRISGGGGGIGQATESEQKYQSAVLENLNNWLSTLSVLTVEAMTRARDNADVITSAISSIELGGNQKNDNGGAGGRPEAMSFKNIISGFQGGLLTASSSVFKEFQKLNQQLRAAAGQGGFAGLIASMTVLSGIITAMPSAFGELVKFASTFVSAMDPGLMAKLGLVVADLMAVIGKGLRPIIVAATVVLRMFADILVPIMTAMQGAMGSLAETLMKVAVPFIVAWAFAIQMMVPIIEGLSQIISANSFIFEGMAKTIMVVIQVVAGAFLFLMAAINAVTGTIKTVAIAFLQIPIVIEEIKDMLWIGKDQGVVDAASKQQESLANSAATDFDAAVKNIKAAFPGEMKFDKGGSSGAAAKQAQYTGIADLGKNMMQAAFSSSTQDIAQKQLNAADQANKFLEQISGFLGIQANGPGKKAAGVRG